MMRHELKYAINQGDYHILHSRLGNILLRDTHTCEHGTYRVRSLYFENTEDHALLAKINGVDRREKFRLRFYNHDTSFIRLEKKIKKNNLTKKVSTPLTEEQVRKLLDGDINWLLTSGIPLLAELYSKMKGAGLRPKTIIAYEREPFIYPTSRVRITLDREIKTGLGSKDFLNLDVPLVPLFDTYAILEVKYDHFLPDVVKQIIQISGRPRIAFSKYVASRKYD